MSKKASKPGEEPEPWELFLKYSRRIATDYEKLNEMNKLLKPIKAKIEELGEPKDLQAWTFVEDMDTLAFRCIWMGLSNAHYKDVKAIRVYRCNEGDEIIRSITCYLDTNPDTQELVLINIGMTYASCGLLARTLKYDFTKITNLRLDYNNLQSKGLELLAEGLTQNKAIKRLSLMYCQLDSAAGDTLSKIIQYCDSRLCYLNVRGNHLKENGILDMLRGCKVTKTLTTIDFSDNEMGDSSAVVNALVNLFIHNTCIKEYYFQDILFSDDSASRILQGILGLEHLAKIVMSERVSSTILEQIDNIVGVKKKKGKKKKST